MTPERIVILNDRSQAFGGATSLALLSAQLFSEAGYDVVYVTGDSGEGAELPEGVELVALGEKPLLEIPVSKGISKGLYNSAARALVGDVIDRFDGPNVVYHIHGWAQIFSPSVFAALSPVEERLLIHAHDFFHACPNGTYFNFQRDEVCGLTPLSGRCFATNCDKRSISQKAFRTTRMMVKNGLFDLAKTRAKIAIIHPFMADWLERAGIPASQQRVVRNPVSPFLQTRVEAENNSDMFFIGRVVAEKGADLAAEAARYAGRRLRVIGDGPDREALARRFPEVVWEGWRSHEEIAKLIGKARGLIMPSRLPEPFGLVALEALQSGVPLVAFPDAFIAREAAGLGCAFVSQARSAASLGHAVTKLNDDAVVANASKIAFEQTGKLSCTQDSWRDQLIEVFEELLGSRRSSSNNLERASEALPPKVDTVARS